MSEVNNENLDQNDQIDENAASDSVKMTKVDIIGQVVKSLNGMTINDLSAWHENAIKTSQTYASSVGDFAASNKKSVDMKGDAKTAIKEEAEALFGELQDLPEDFRFKAVTLFESAVATRVSVELVEKEAALEEKFNADFDALVEELNERVETYLEAAADKWIEENEVAIESSLRLENAEKLIGAIRGALTEAHVFLPEEQTDVLASAEARVAELEEKLNESVEEVLELNNEIKRRDARATFEKVAEGLAMTDKEKFKTLVEDVDVDENLEEKLTVIREANFKKADASQQTKQVGKEVIGEETVVVINESVETDAVKVNPMMDPYVAALKNLVR